MVSFRCSPVPLDLATLLGFHPSDAGLHHLCRANWQQHLNDVLDGRLTLDDVEGVVAECLSKVTRRCW